MVGVVRIEVGLRPSARIAAVPEVSVVVVFVGRSEKKYYHRKILKDFDVALAVFFPYEEEKNVNWTSLDWTNIEFFFWKTSAGRD